MLNHKKSTRVARELGQPYYRLYALIRDGRIPAPSVDDSGDYCWSPQDIARAKKALVEGPRKRMAVAV